MNDSEKTLNTQEKPPRDVSAEFQECMQAPHGVFKFLDFLRTLRKEPTLLLRVDLSIVEDEVEFTQRAKFLKGFKESKEGSQKRISIIRATRRQRYGEKKKSLGWAANVFSSGVEWEEVKV